MESQQIKAQERIIIRGWQLEDGGEHTAREGGGPIGAEWPSAARRQVTSALHREELN